MQTRLALQTRCAEASSRPQGFVRLLATFGLYLPEPATIPGVPNATIADNMATIAVKLRQAPWIHTTITLARERYDENPDTHSIINLPSTTFDLRKNAEEGLRRFLNQWSITACSASKLAGGSVAEHPTALQDAQPRWMLIHKLRHRDF